MMCLSAVGFRHRLTLLFFRDTRTKVSALQSEMASAILAVIQTLNTIIRPAHE
jgi:hypothetical protein